MHQATCQCGALVLTAKADPDFVIACNCQACQRRTGSAFGVGAYFDKGDVSVSGATESWARKADSGREVENFFCPSCGTNVFWTLEMRPDYFGVAHGNFTTKLPDPLRVIWTEEQRDWVRFPDSMPHFPKGSPPST